MKRSLMRAAESNDIHTLCTLLDTVKSDVQYRKILHVLLSSVVERNHIDIARELLARGADSNIVYKGRVPLHDAIEYNYIDMVQLLLEYGADPNIPTDEDDRGNEMYAIHLAADNGYLSIVELLLDHGVDINQTTFHGHSLLHIAYHTNNMDMFHYLLERGANPKYISTLNSTLCNDLNVLLATYTTK